MDILTALKNVEALANRIDPISGEVLSECSPLSIKFEVRHFLQMRMNILRWCSIPKPFAWACI
ncbi:hypothetical protein DYL72_18815 [Vibrio anguillarum]|uniref:Uncharacterized protein n=1 Tax=Vibrio anguillarum TaxID=55601 RepID=A0A7U6J5R4_VIBAN|nr:hypothetical protein DYL72_18815 [Vibrio anguillarum]